MCVIEFNTNDDPSTSPCSDRDERVSRRCEFVIEEDPRQQPDKLMRGNKKNVILEEGNELVHKDR
jgi:hypothetical protein